MSRWAWWARWLAARCSARWDRSFHYSSHGFIVSTLVAVIGAVIVIAIWNAITGHRPLR